MTSLSMLLVLRHSIALTEPRQACPTMPRRTIVVEFALKKPKLSNAAAARRSIKIPFFPLLELLVRIARIKLGGFMITLMICLILTILVLGWVLHTNARDRQLFEQELEDEFPDRLGD